MILVLYGTEEYLIDKEINSLIQKHHINDIGIVKYDLENNPLEQILEDASMPSLFDENKIIICDRSYILTGVHKKNTIEQDISKLEGYIQNPNSSTILILKVVHDKLDVRKKIVKLLKKECTVKEYNTIKNTNDFVKTLFNGYKIDSNTISLFTNRVGDNLLLLENEAEKIKLYKYDEKEIKEEDILNLISKTIDLDIFTFIDNIICKRKEQAIETYKEMIKLNEEPIAIIIMLANQFRIMYQSKELMKRGYTEKAIAETLDIHPFRVKKALEKANLYTSSTLLSFLDKLREMDYQIKTGKTDKYLVLELFILGL